MINKFIRNFIAKQMAGRSDDGIMITLRDPQKVELAENIMADLLMRNGIDPRAITSEQQLKNIINQIDAASKQTTQSGIKNTESAKVFNTAGEELDPSKPIMGGTQQGKKINQDFFIRNAESQTPPPGSRGGPDDIAAPVQSSEESLKNMIIAENKKNISAMKNRKMIKDSVENASPGFVKGDRKYNAQLVADDLADKKFGKEFYDLDQKQQMDLYDEALEGLSEQTRGMPDPEDFAKGGIARIGLFKGAQADTKKGKAMSPGTSTTGGVRDDNPFTGGGGGGNNNPPPNTPPVKSPIESPFTKSVPPPSGLIKNLSPSILARLARMRKGFTPILGEDIGLQYQNIDELYDTLTNFRITQDLENLIKTKKLEPELKYRKEIGDNTLIEGGINQEGDASIMFKKQFADGGRIGLKDGMNRRTFLKIFSGLVSLPIIGKVLKPLKMGKTVSKVPIIKTADVPGKPEWFDQLVNKVILEGDDVTKKFATQERQVVHMKKIDDDTSVTVTQDLNDGSIMVDVDDPVRNVMGEGPNFNPDTSLIMRLKKGQADETTKGTPADEFDFTENDMRNYMDGPDDYTTEFTENTVNKMSDLTSDLSKIESYATGKGPTMKQIVESKKRREMVKLAEENPAEYASGRGPEFDPPEPDDFASGGIARMLGE